MTSVGAYLVGDGLLFLELMISKLNGAVLKETIFLSVEFCPNKNNFLIGYNSSSSLTYVSYLNSFTTSTSLSSTFGSLFSFISISRGG